MALNGKNSDPARELENIAGVSTPAAAGPSLLEEIAAIQKRLAKVKIQDNRSADDIIGYDENGSPR